MQDHPHRKDIRWKQFDYTMPCNYFVTIDIHDQLHLLGKVEAGRVYLNEAGLMVDEVLSEMCVRYQGTEMINYVIMPNHIHLLLLNRGCHYLPDMMRWFKSVTTNRYIKGVKEAGWSPFRNTLWLRSYYDRVIRDQDEFNNVMNYIDENPQRWESRREEEVLEGRTQGDARSEKEAMNYIDENPQQGESRREEEILGGRTQGDACSEKEAMNYIDENPQHGESRREEEIVGGRTQGDACSEKEAMNYIDENPQHGESRREEEIVGGRTRGYARTEKGAEGAQGDACSEKVAEGAQGNACSEKEAMNYIDENPQQGESRREEEILEGRTRGYARTEKGAEGAQGDACSEKGAEGAQGDACSEKVAEGAQGDACSEKGAEGAQGDACSEIVAGRTRGYARTEKGAEDAQGDACSEIVAGRTRGYARTEKVAEGAQGDACSEIVAGRTRGYARTVLLLMLMFASCSGGQSYALHTGVHMGTPQSEDKGQPHQEVGRTQEYARTEVYGGAPLRTGAEVLMGYVSTGWLDDKRVAVVGNQTSIVGSTHLVDTLLSSGVDVRKIFCPEHGFRGTAAAGAHVDNSSDPKTGLPIISLYGKNKKPTPEQMKGVDCVVFDLQDVGCRFYTYISTLHYVMEACAEAGIPLVVLDRPNPNGHYVDGPVLDTAKYRSFVGMHPVPIVYGMTIGEYAQMINGEGWLKGGIRCDLTVVPMEGYRRDSVGYELPVAPSPNLRTAHAVALYPSLCLFEGTHCGVGRGTDWPFEWVTYGADTLDLRQEGRGDLGSTSVAEPVPVAFSLKYLMEMYRRVPKGKFFLKSNFFEKLAGGGDLRKQIESGMSEEEIRATWQPGLEEFKKIREKYLIYGE